jgi:hypothetical protein
MRFSSGVWLENKAFTRPALKAIAVISSIVKEALIEKNTNV